MKITIIKIITILFVLLGLYLFLKPSPCVEGLKFNDSKYVTECIDGKFVERRMSEKERAIQAKVQKAMNEKRLAELESFCGKDNVDRDFMECKNYSLVPDENLK